MKKFEYSKTEYEKICEECMLDDEECTILRLRCQGKSRQEILFLLDDIGKSMSLSTLGRKITKIENKIKSKIKKAILRDGL